MKNNTLRVVAVLAAALPFHVPDRVLAGSGEPGGSPAASRPALERARLPIAFEENRGQVNAQVGFLARGRDAALFLARDGATLALHGVGDGARGAALRIVLAGAHSEPCLEGGDALPGRVSYLRGGEPSRWVRAAPTYARVRYEEVYPGIDLVFHGSEGRLEYDFVVRPGADPDSIRLTFEGAERIELRPGGELVVGAGGREMVQHAPVAYQLADAGRVPVASRAVLAGDEVAFEVGPYDRSRELVIDPVLAVSTYLGGSDGDEAGNGVVVDGQGNVYVTGETVSADFPTTVGAFDTSYNGEKDVFIAKLDPYGSQLLYSTYLGGATAWERPWDIEVDPAGNAYVAGETESPDFPTTPGAFDTTHNGGPDGFLAKLDATGGALVYSTFLGGASNDYVQGIVLDASGNALAAGMTASSSFPTTPGAFDRTYNGDGDAFVAKLNASGSALLYSTYLGGPAPSPRQSGYDSARDVTLDASGNAYVCGLTQGSKFPTTSGAFDRTIGGPRDAFVTKLNPSGSALVYSTYLGGSGDEMASGIAVDASGAAHVTGHTTSSGFPTTAGAYDRTYNGSTDVFVTRLNAAGSALAYSTFLGGSASDRAALQGIALDASGAAYVCVDETFSVDFPTTIDALDVTLGGERDVAIAKLNPAGSQLVYGSYLGGRYWDSGSGGCSYRASTSSLHVAGVTMSDDFPTTAGAFQGALNGYADAFVVRLDF